MNADILLKRNRIETVTSEFFGITTGEHEEPDIKLSPNSASLRLGGGGGDFSDGDLRLMDRPGDDGESEPRVHLTGGSGKTHDSTRVRVDGTDGAVKLGAESADDPDVRLRPTEAALDLGGGSAESSDGNITLSDGNGNSRIQMESTGPDGTLPAADRSVYISGGGFGGDLASDDGDTGGIWLGKVGEDFVDSPISLNANNAHLSVGSELESGSVSVSSESGGETISLESDPEESEGGELVVSSETGIEAVEANGADGQLTLGGRESLTPDGATGVTGTVGTGTISETTSDGFGGTIPTGTTRETINGTLSLFDGAGMMIDLEASGRTVTLGQQDDSEGEIALELEPANGVFRLVDGDGDAVFEVDTQDKKIKHARGYSRGPINRGR